MDDELGLLQEFRAPAEVLTVDAALTAVHIERAVRRLGLAVHCAAPGPTSDNMNRMRVGQTHSPHHPSV